jgi:nucleoid DNA-binding protein
MHKQGFIDHIANQHGCTKKEAEKAIDMFMSSVILVLVK